MSKSKPAADAVRVLVRNRRAKHDYQVHETLEAGIVLVGSEVKSLRESKATLTDCYADVRGGEVWLIGATINEYAWANQFNHEPKRQRKLLLHRREIARLEDRIQLRGNSVIPLAIYLKDGRMKVELAVASGKKMYEKREASREADAKREIERALKATRPRDR